MTLCGKGAMVLYYDIVPEFIGDHDDWHTHEHFSERLSIPGFLRASRWVATTGNPRYLVIYEVSDVPVLSSGPYLERLNNPTPWTSRTMPHFRGMTRGFCRVSGSGAGLGHALLSIRYLAAAGRDRELREWLGARVLPGLASQRGVVSAIQLEPAAQPPMTKEQGIRGKDAEMPNVLLVTGYDAAVLARAGEEMLSDAQFEKNGATGVPARGSYRLDLLQSAAECGS